MIQYSESLSLRGWKRLLLSDIYWQRKTAADEYESKY